MCTTTAIAYDIAGAFLKYYADTNSLENLRESQFRQEVFAVLDSTIRLGNDDSVVGLISDFARFRSFPSQLLEPRFFGQVFEPLLLKINFGEKRGC